MGHLRVRISAKPSEDDAIPAIRLGLVEGSVGRFDQGQLVAQPPGRAECQADAGGDPELLGTGEDPPAGQARSDSLGAFAGQVRGGDRQGHHELFTTKPRDQILSPGRFPDL